MSMATWMLADANGNVTRTLRFGPDNGTPVTGDWSGDGTTKIGVFLDGAWFFDMNGNGVWDEPDLWLRLGKAGDQPVVGDWDGDGKSDIGIFGPAWSGDQQAVKHEPGLSGAGESGPGATAAQHKNIPHDAHQTALGLRMLRPTSVGRFREDLIDHVFQYGKSKDIPVAGDWNGKGVATIGVFRDGEWFLDSDGDGKWSQGNIHAHFGQAGDIPVVGDWTGDGVTKIGVYRQGVWYLDTNNNHILDAQDQILRLGGPGDVPVVGDWNGDGMDKIGIYRAGHPALASRPPTVTDNSALSTEPTPQLAAPVPLIGAALALLRSPSHRLHKDRRINKCRIVVFRSAKVAAIFRGAKGDHCFRADSKRRESPPVGGRWAS